MLLRFFLPTRTQSLSKFFITTRNNEKPNYVLETMGVLSARAQGSREVAQQSETNIFICENIQGLLWVIHTPFTVIKIRRTERKVSRSPLANGSLTVNASWPNIRAEASSQQCFGSENEIEFYKLLGWNLIVIYHF